MDKLFEISTEDITNKVTLDKKELFPLVDKLIKNIKKDVKYGLTNDLIFKTTPYKTIISDMDKVLSKLSGLNIIHIPSNKTYVAYTKDSFLKKGFIKTIKDYKNVEKIFKNISDEIPKVIKGKVKGKKEESLTTYIKADFYDMIVNKDMNSDDLTDCIAGEVEIAIKNIENMRATVDDVTKMSRIIKSGNIDKLLKQNGINAEGLTTKDKLKNIINIVINKYGTNIVLTNTSNPYSGEISTEDIGEGRTKVPLGTRLSYFFLLLLCISLIVIIGIPTLAQLAFLGYAIIAYVAFYIIYSITRFILIIFTGYDISEKPNSKTNGAVGFLNNMFKMGTNDISNVDKDIAESSKSNLNILNNLYNGKLSTELMNLENDISMEDIVLIENITGVKL